MICRKKKAARKEPGNSPGPYYTNYYTNAI
jgi:hypothetical protein